MFSKIKLFLMTFKVLDTIKRHKGGQSYEVYTKEQINYMIENGRREQYINELLDKSENDGISDTYILNEIKDSDFCEKSMIIYEDDNCQLWRVFMFNGRIVDIEYKLKNQNQEIQIKGWV